MMRRRTRLAWRLNDLFGKRPSLPPSRAAWQSLRLIAYDFDRHLCESKTSQHHSQVNRSTVRHSSGTCSPLGMSMAPETPKRPQIPRWRTLRSAFVRTWKTGDAPIRPDVASLNSGTSGSRFRAPIARADRVGACRPPTPSRSEIWHNLAHSSRISGNFGDAPGTFKHLKTRGDLANVNVIKSFGLASQAYDEGSIPFTRSILNCRHPGDSFPFFSTIWRKGSKSADFVSSGAGQAERHFSIENVRDVARGSGIAKGAPRRDRSHAMTSGGPPLAAGLLRPRPPATIST
jgi:hypothetical protein